MMRTGLDDTSAVGANMEARGQGSLARTFFQFLEQDSISAKKVMDALGKKGQNLSAADTFEYLSNL
jgi:hypothetical protein